MTAKRKIALVAIFAIIALVSAFALVACDGGVKDVVAEGYKENFTIGDEFTVGDNFVVYAVDAAGNKTDVTAEATVRPEKGMDMNMVGDYMITVEYQGKKFVYKIYVDGFDNILSGLRINTDNVKKSYQLGDEIDFSGIVITELYVNGQGQTVERDYTQIGKFGVTVTDAHSNECTTLLSDFGEHTVTISSGSFSASYKVSVDGVNLSSASAALGVGNYGKQFVKQGTMSVSEGLVNAFDSQFNMATIQFFYEFNDGYTHINEKFDTHVADYSYNRDYYYGIDPDTDKMSLITVEKGVVSPSNATQRDAMAGVTLNLWYYSKQVYGLENALNNIYQFGKDDPNGDWTESADVQNRKYSFSFGYFQDRIGNEGDYFFMTSVEFTLSQEYAIVYAKITQEQYVEGDYQIGADGKVSITGKKAYLFEVEANQVVGTRDAENPYSPNAMKVTSFDLVYNGQVLKDGDTITGSVIISSDDRYVGTAVLQIQNILPTTANIAADLPTFTDGLGTPQAEMYYGMGYSVLELNGSKNITITFMNGGDWVFIMQLGKVTKTLNIKITGIAPTDLSTQVYNTAFDSFTNVNERSVIVGTKVYFKAVPNQYANGAFTAALTSGTNATVKETELNGQACWEFVATQPGSYTVTMTSSVASSVQCTLQINVIDIPNFAELLNGEYTVKDVANNVYTLTFSQTSSQGGVITGTLTAVCASEESEKSQVFSFTAQEEGLTIQLTEVSGTKLGISLEISSDGKLVMRDLYETAYVLTKSE